ncbi:hypothetical protein JMM63_12505 [Rhodovulum sulfidophilum]|uniref:Adenylosuccinate lyase n=1 Tax=Rhodovulum sulfidophilum TaxID=35806 RepID=A0ABS1RUU7_RHOSU|nr:hypothetical protein [Rhodovulum sulfidophilum]MBL3553317.1 hypothetical protein [Rhodovulum sulfidophilum]MBL3562447.1 hypothetical protein [Rhodovulum sulfidophilum]MBL3565491.1 hypothetical protein [Rhodovulum sulfidophilum]MBL3574760.1 hypothetical protein [Rhodovulum sulfidophilum]MBL3586360.1 hypothetical protein [Rhodovulum sulfidophilum]
MTTRTILAAAALALLPAFASAECGWQKRINASQCGDGQIFDAASGQCVTQSTS